VHIIFHFLSPPPHSEGWGFLQSPAFSRCCSFYRSLGLLSFLFALFLWLDMLLLHEHATGFDNTLREVSLLPSFSALRGDTPAAHPRDCQTVREINECRLNAKGKTAKETKKKQHKQNKKRAPQHPYHQPTLDTRMNTDTKTRNKKHSMPIPLHLLMSQTQPRSLTADGTVGCDCEKGREDGRSSCPHKRNE